MMINACDVLPQCGDAFPDRILHGIYRGRIVSNIQQDALDALSPGVVLHPQMGQFLPDADLVWLRRTQSRFVQHVERDVGQIFHGAKSTRLWRFVCGLAF